MVTRKEFWCHLRALAQAREFHKATPLDSVIITKMDGSGTVSYTHLHSFQKTGSKLRLHVQRLFLIRSQQMVLARHKTDLPGRLIPLSLIHI